VAGPARLLITGGSGYLGGELLRRAPGAVGTAFSRAGEVRLDVRDRAAVAALVGPLRPDSVIHTAYAREGADAWSTNVDGAANVAACAEAAGAHLIHVSTDVVFAGDEGRPYTESDPPRPITEYGRSKAAAEEAVAAAHRGAAIVRTSLIYGGAEPSGHEQAALAAAAGRADLAFFTDEIRCPIAVGDLAAALLELAEARFCGILHVAGADAVSRLEFAELVARAGGRDPARLRPSTAAAAPAPRPRDCRLDCSRARQILATRLRGVHEVLESGYGPSRSITQPLSPRV
jgi:dTDP-4-dehydrorhamnose reductase